MGDRYVQEARAGGATPPSERVGHRAKESPRAAVNSSDTKYKLINTRRGRAYGSRARAEGIDMRSVVSKKESCLKSPFAQMYPVARVLIGVWRPCAGYRVHG